eukprot:2332587-Amphidinium_carterae.1
MGKAVLRRNNQLRKMCIGRMRANEGYHHDSSSSSGHSVLTADKDFISFRIIVTFVCLSCPSLSLSCGSSTSLHEMLF